MDNDNLPTRELRMDDDFVHNIAKNEGYRLIEAGFSESLNKEFLGDLFSYALNFDSFLEVPVKNRHLVTGFGPTNSPTGGTLSMILRTIMLERELHLSSTIVISNLGAFDSRNIAMAKLDYYTHRFIAFIKALGFEGEIRTHSSFDLQVASTIVAKVLELRDFLDNQEVTAGLYESLNIQGQDFPTLIDSNYTVADILLPVLKEGKERILVCVGIEEHYFPKLANIVLERLDNRFPHEFVSENTKVTALFGKLILGLNGYPKMSKSIPSSSINLDDSIEVIKNKILFCKKEDEKIILQMIQLVSDWPPLDVAKAEEAFVSGGSEWTDVKNKYLGYYLKLKQSWSSTEFNYKFDSKKLFIPLI